MTVVSTPRPIDVGRLSVFCDFDGTISRSDIGKHLMTRIPTPGWEVLDAQYDAGEIGSRACVDGQWELMARDEALVRAVAAEVELDPTFEPLVAALWAAGAEVAIVSDGFGFYVQEYADRLGVDCYTNAVDWERWELLHPFEDRCCACSSCGTCKQAPIKDARRRGRVTVMIGDGTSDRKAALLADIVFAKNALAEWCDHAAVPYTSFDRLADVHRELIR